MQDITRHGRVLVRVAGSTLANRRQISLGETDIERQGTKAGLRAIVPIPQTRALG
jgi:hypothetical protein